MQRFPISKMFMFRCRLTPPFDHFRPFLIEKENIFILVDCDPAQFVSLYDREPRIVSITTNHNKFQISWLQNVLMPVVYFPSTVAFPSCLMSRDQSSPFHLSVWPLNSCFLRAWFWHPKSRFKILISLFRCFPIQMYTWHALNFWLNTRRVLIDTLEISAYTRNVHCHRTPFNETREKANNHNFKRWYQSWSPNWTSTQSIRWFSRHSVGKIRKR